MSRRKEYKRINKIINKEGDKGLTEKMKKWLGRVCAETWKHFDNHEGEPLWSMVNQEMLNKLDELNERWLENGGRTMFIEDEDGEYWKEVYKVLEEHIVSSMRTDRQEEIVRVNILAKLKWYANESGNEGHRLTIPILTPKLLDALAANIDAAANAYQEVSLF